MKIKILGFLLLATWIFLAPPSMAQGVSSRYIDRVQAAVKRAWHPPRIGAGGKVKVGFSVDHAGRVSDIAILQSSGNKLLERAVVNTVKRAKVPPVPASVERKKIDVEMRFDVQVNLNMPG